ncbi:hypothetical protein KAJ27_21345 [bacterium]|nr:hypothetical protein [bacterium]
MSELNFYTISLDLKSDSRDVKLDRLKLLFHSDLKKFDRIEDILFILLDILLSSTDDEIVYFARQIFHRVLNLKSIDYDYYFQADGKLIISKAIICLKDGSASEVITFLSYLSRRVINNLENDRLYIFLSERLDTEPKLLAIIFILKLLPGFLRKTSETAKILSKFLYNRNHYIVAAAIEGLGILKNDDHVVLISRFLTDQKRILAASSVKALLQINTDFAIMEVRKISMMDTEDSKKRLCYLLGYFPPEEKSFQFIVDQLLIEKSTLIANKLIDIIFKKLDSKNFRLLLDAMLDLDVNDQQMDVYNRIFEHIHKQFGLDNETIDLLKKLNEHKVKQKKIVESEKKNTEKIAVSKKASGLRGKVKANGNVLPKNTIRNNKRIYVSIAVIVVIIIATITLTVQQKDSGASKTEFITPNKQFSYSTPVRTPIERALLKRKKKNGNFDRKPEKKIVLEGIVTHAVPSPVSGGLICIVESEKEKYRVEFADKIEAKDIKKGDFIKMKGIVSKTDAIGIIYFYCLKMF